MDLHQWQQELKMATKKSCITMLGTIRYIEAERVTLVSAMEVKIDNVVDGQNANTRKECISKYDICHAQLFRA